MPPHYRQCHREQQERVGVVLIHTVIQGPKNFTKFNIQLLRSSKGQWEDGGREKYRGSQRGFWGLVLEMIYHFFPHFHWVELNYISLLR